MVYLLKFSTVLLILIIFYKIFLEHEKTFKFNRFFLLTSLLFSVISPFFVIYVSPEWLDIPTQQTQNIVTQSEFIGSPINIKYVEQPSLNYYNILLTIYWTVFILLAFRFVWNLKNLIAKCNKYGQVINNKFHIVLDENKILPHSFFNYLFFNREDFENGKIDATIIRHEQRHAEAYHSIDIILMELTLLFFWFNPILYWYKKTMLLNHEFYADLQNDNKNLKYYQRLILSQVFPKKANYLASGFNYSFIKKRMKMLQKSHNGPYLRVKQSLIIPLLLIISLVVSKKMISQNNSTTNHTVVFINGNNSTSNTTFSHLNHDNKTMNSDEIGKIIKSEGITSFDKIGIVNNGKKYEGSAVTEFKYLEDKSELFMRGLSNASALIIIQTEKSASGKKVREVKIDESNDDAKASAKVVYNDSESMLPPPPPPVQRINSNGSNKYDNVPGPPPPPVAPNAPMPPAPPVPPAPPTPPAPPVPPSPNIEEAELVMKAEQVRMEAEQARALEQQLAMKAEMEKLIEQQVEMKAEQEKMVEQQLAMKAEMEKMVEQNVIMEKEKAKMKEEKAKEEKEKLKEKQKKEKNQ